MATVVAMLIVMGDGEQDAQESISPSLDESDESTDAVRKRSRFAAVTRQWKLYRKSSFHSLEPVAGQLASPLIGMPMSG